jgi:type IV pilus assembly protein PilX
MNEMKNMKKQKGTILFISLMILLILTIMGLSSMQGSVMQEKMTAAVRDGSVALEGAEATIHFVEQNVIEPLATTGIFNNSNCLYDVGGAPRQDPNGAWPEGTWTGNGTCVASSINVRGDSSVGGSDGSIAEAPRYFVELSGELETDEEVTDIMIFNYNNNAGAGALTGFKIVARSVGSSTSSQKFVAAYYGKRI